MVSKWAVMGASDSKAKSAPLSPGAAVAAEMQSAMVKCNKALQYLDTSATMLATKRNKARETAIAAYRQADHLEAIELLRKADLAESDLQTIRKRQMAIERQKSMIEQQQLNTMLTSVLVDTSAALHAANMGAGESSAEVVHLASRQMEEVADAQADIADSHVEFDDACAAAAVGFGCSDALDSSKASELERLAAMSEQHAGPTSSAVLKKLPLDESATATGSGSFKPPAPPSIEMTDMPSVSHLPDVCVPKGPPALPKGDAVLMQQHM